MFFFMFICAIALVKLSVANTGIPESQFRDDPYSVAKAGAPMFHFVHTSCTPSPGETGGKQATGNDEDLCTGDRLNSGCPPLLDFKGPNTEAYPFPTYYTVHSCGDGTWRVTYSIYFKHDSGHSNDWEYASVVWRKDGNLFYRGALITEVDGTRQRRDWHSLQSTYTDDGDKFKDGGYDRNHPKVYVGRYRHTTHHDKGLDFKGDCAVSGGNEFRTNDYYFESQNWLVSGWTIPAEWNWGKADSAPLCTIGLCKRYQDVCQV